MPTRETEVDRELETLVEPFVGALGREAVDAALAKVVDRTQSKAKTRLAKRANDPIIGDNDANTIVGGFGNDEIEARGGDDLLFGSKGDDKLYGEGGDDFLAGGHGGDLLQGGQGSDWSRGDGSDDSIVESSSPGASDVDTLSYATGVTPGFSDSLPTTYTNFPSSTDGRGVYLDLSANVAKNSEPKYGGGVDATAPSSSTKLARFESIVGTAFSDYIVGTDNAEMIDGGGGQDVILGKGGSDWLFGNGGGDNIDGGAGTNIIDGGAWIDYCSSGPYFVGCNETWSGPTHVVPPTEPDKVRVAFVAADRTSWAANKFLELYVSGGSNRENLDFTYSDNGSSPDSVTFTLTTGSFDTTGTEEMLTTGNRCDYTLANSSPKRVVCYFTKKLDSIVVAGFDGDDDLSSDSTSIGETTSLTLLGGDDNDYLAGSNASHDVLVDGAGNDLMYGRSADDGLIVGAGTDTVDAGSGEDLILSTNLCDSDSLDGGGSERNNASWLKVDGTDGVTVDLANQEFGTNNGTSTPFCAGGSGLGSIIDIRNLEGSWFDDRFIGGNEDNTFIGWLGEDELVGGSGADKLYGYFPGVNDVAGGDADTYDAGPGNDTIGSVDDLPEKVAIDCGSGADTGVRDSVDSVDANCDSAVVP
ncbi:MAG: calcium-binding protein [Solirubrobacterales bacterium]